MFRMRKTFPTFGTTKTTTCKENIMKGFYFHLPGMVYAVIEYGRTKAEAVETFKRKNNITRMPIGHAIWPA